jgi:thiamine pyrophosphokinase
MRGFLFTGGAAPTDKNIFDGTDLARFLPYRGKTSQNGLLIVAADEGARICRRLGIDPDLIIGDMDSLNDPVFLEHYPPEIIRRLPVDKDQTDTEAALAWLKQEGANDITIIGGGEGRLDHLLVILNLFRKPDPPVLWLTAREKIFPVTGTMVIEGTPGDLISFFPLATGTCRMSTTGLKWPLDTLKWHPGDNGVSNRMTSDNVTIRMRSGSLLCVKPFTGS